VHALPGLCALNIFEYEISLSCGKFRNHHREPLLGHGNTFDRGRPVVYTYLKQYYAAYNTCLYNSRNTVHCAFVPPVQSEIGSLTPYVQSDTASSAFPVRSESVSLTSPVQS
jgi:hypothetical protein